MVVGSPASITRDYNSEGTDTESEDVDIDDDDDVDDGETDDEEKDFEGELEREIVEAVQADTNEDAEPTTGDVADLEALTVVELKERLRSRGLPVSGRKAELIERLQQ